MKKPQYISETDKYFLTIEDFPTRFEKYIFSAIYNLYKGGAQAITVVDVANYFNTHEIAKATFEKNNGIEYLQDIMEFSEADNFPFYYKRLKKFNLLTELNKMGYDTSGLYEENLTNPRAKEINDKFELMDIPDIMDFIKKPLLQLETEYTKGNDTETVDATKNIQQLIKNLKLRPEVGAALQGKIFNTVCRGARKTKFYIRSASSGIGKALPNSAVIPTPSGWKRVDEIKEGDYLFDAFGKPTKVLGVYPQGEKEVYQVTFKDGRTARCCNEHLWSYNTSSQSKRQKEKRSFYTKSLKEISKEPLKNKDGGYRILVPMQRAVEYKEKNHYIPPYIMGLILGDGSFVQNPSNKSFQYSSENEILPNFIGKAMNWIVKKASIKNYTWYFFTKEKQHKNEKINVWVEDILKEYPELVNATSLTKFIPRDYIEDSIKNRYELLSGLLDSDGHVDEKGRISYYTISESLRDNVIEIARSLGFKTRVIVDTHKSTNTCYAVSIQGRPEDKVKLFKLKRKKDIIEKWYISTKRFEKNTHNPIISIESLNYSEEMTCFYVDNKEHLFLTENFIVTHNTRAAVGDACSLAYPLTFNTSKWEWEWTGAAERTLFIATEQDLEEIQTLILAFLSGINEEKILYGSYNEEEEKVIQQAIQVMEYFKDNLYVVRLSNPNIEQIKAVVRQNWILYDIQNVFYDYIFSSPSLLNEFRDLRIREDRPRVICPLT